MLESIRKLSLGFQLVYMGSLINVLCVVVDLTFGFALPINLINCGPFFVYIVSPLLSILLVAVGVCKLIGYLIGITGRYLCTMTTEIPQKARADIRASVTLEMIAFILNMITALLPYLLTTLAETSILLESHALFSDVYNIVSGFGSIALVLSLLYFVIYMRDLACFVGSDDLSMRSEKIRRLIVLLLQLSFVNVAIKALLIFDRIVMPNLVIVFVAMISALGFLKIVILVQGVFVSYRFIGVAVAMSAVLEAYNGPTNEKDSPGAIIA